MADEETRIRISAVDNTAQAARSAAENIRRIGEATRAVMVNRRPPPAGLVPDAPVHRHLPKRAAARRSASNVPP
jgi:hypothetical protein